MSRRSSRRRERAPQLQLLLALQLRYVPVQHRRLPTRTGASLFSRFLLREQAYNTNRDHQGEGGPRKEEKRNPRKNASSPSGLTL
jgi:hypothetical protein